MITMVLFVAITHERFATVHHGWYCGHCCSNDRNGSSSDDSSQHCQQYYHEVCSHCFVSFGSLVEEVRASPSHEAAAAEESRAQGGA